MADAQVLLKHNETGHTALFPAAADLDAWRALGWHEEPPAAATEKTTPAKAAAKRGAESEEKA